MVKSDKSYKWFVRVDCNKDAGIACAGIINGWIDLKRLLMVHHMGDKKDNPHVHFIMELSSELQKQSLDTRLKKVFTIEKRSQYSSKVWDGKDECGSYLFHESNDCVVYNKGFTQDELDRFVALNASVQKVITVNNEKASCRAPARAVEYFKGESPSRREVLALFIKWIRDGEMYEPGDFQLARYVEEVVIKTTASEDLDWYVDSRYKRIFRD